MLRLVGLSHMDEVQAVVGGQSVFPALVRLREGPLRLAYLIDAVAGILH